MGEYAEAAIWAEINGRDPSDMGPEDWEDFYDDTAPPEASDLAVDARMILHGLRGWIDEDAPVTLAEVLAGLVPEMNAADCASLVGLLGKLVEAVEARPEEPAPDA